jgi:NitT/TauT family transport system ATP-binding protein
MGITARHITFSYESRVILADLDLTIPEGEMWGLVGRSGTGKTTLLQVLAGLFEPTSGEVTVSGREGMGAGRIRGVVFQDDSLLGWLSAIDNLLFPHHRTANGTQREQAVKTLESVGLADRASDFPNQFSAGMRKRLEFARALLADNHYILADEPFGTLDALTRRDLWSLWAAARKTTPRTGLLSTHDAEEALRLCDAVAVLRSVTPTHVAEIVQVPPSVRALGANCDNQELWTLRDAIVRSLGVQP